MSLKLYPFIVLQFVVQLFATLTALWIWGKL